MSRLPTVIPIIILVGLPLWTDPSLAVGLIGLLAALFCVAGVLGFSVSSITVGGSLAVIDYALALWLSAGGADIPGAAAFGLALLFLLDATEFARRFRHVDVAAAVKRTQAVYWLGRAAIAAGAVALLTVAGTALASVVPGAGRSIIAGLGATIVFAAAMRAGFLRGGRDDA